MLTRRDREIVDVLLFRVRVLSLAQVAETWWRGDAARAAGRLRLLAGAGWLAGERLLARPLLALEAPLGTWGPGEPAPDFGGLSYRARARWTSPAVPTAAWHAAPVAAARLGGRARASVKNACQVTHDLHVAECYLRLLRAADPAAAWWAGEDALPPGLVGSSVPDAVLVRRGRPVRAIEFGGAYPPERFERFHAHCEAVPLPYAIW